MRIDVKTLPVNDIIKDISNCFGVPVENAAGELKIEIPKNIGEGYIRGSSFKSGIGIITYNCKFLEDVDIHFTLNSIHPLKFIFCSEGKVEHCFENSDESVIIDNFQNIIVSSSGYRGHVLSFKKDVAVHVSSLEIIRSVFSHRDNYQFEGMEPDLKAIFKDQVSEKEFFYQGNYSLKSADLMEQIETKDFSGFLRSIYLEGKAFEMLVVQIDQYQDDEAEDKLPQILRKSDVEKVNYVARRIEGDLATNLTVEALAKEAGTNVNKLQEGFKYVYDLTVNKYIQHRKLEAAKEMLMNSDRNISEIVNSIGLNNRSYFSKIFKEKYGVSPKYFRKSSLRHNQV
ncbi:helix-turn-helix domain-containing protein [Zunongwangia sp. HGR-M22]|uniref:helix-turn-helix domain-containing protein n=1 Tax=Zunongwangia sp. HGR-M22 TaxID=3015168 RepID=UPI0022DD6C7B|nr:AraC family transcriptional regulator [Zunongwangia sp. HGR-M22]WBL25234.1 AraC family transcriptional regulator [Zunongwangia sp. HGR-M22]